MPISIECPSCGLRIKAPDKAAGRKAACPKCKGPVSIPGAIAPTDILEESPQAPVPMPPIRVEITTDPSEKRLPAAPPVQVNVSSRSAGGFMTGLGLSFGCIAGLVAIPLVGFLTCAGFVVTSLIGGAGNRISDARDRVNQPYIVAGPDGTSRHGDIQVTVSGARVGKANVKSALGGEPFEEDAVRLLVSIKVENLSTTKKITYSGWGGDSIGVKPELKDNHGNTYRLVSYNISRTLVGQVAFRELYPGKSVDDLIAFEPPVDAADVLLLELPGVHVDTLERFRFQIPKTLWSK